MQKISAERFRITTASASPSPATLAEIQQRAEQRSTVDEPATAVLVRCHVDEGIAMIVGTLGRDRIAQELRVSRGCGTQME